MNEKSLLRKLYKKPLYKIGDIIVYQNRYRKVDDSMYEVYQSKIIEASALYESDDKKDELSWNYITELSDKEQEDSIYEGDIMYKL